MYVGISTVDFLIGGRATSEYYEFMCGRYALYQISDIGGRFDLDEPLEFDTHDNFNAAPRQEMPIVIDKEGKRVAELMQWGFVPFWSKNPAKEKIRPINTKSETAFNSRLWQGAVKHRRAIVPARGFYEWKREKTNGGAAHKVPYFIHPNDQDLFGFAGIYSQWGSEQDQLFYSFSIMTTAPNKDIKQIHNRMPVILTPDEESLWLDPGLDSQEPLAEMLAPYKDERLELYRVSREVNSPFNNDEKLVRPSLN